MSTAWVAGSVRARALARRRLGQAAVRDLARQETLRNAVTALTGTPYGREVRSGDTLAQAQHAVAATTLWHLRVLAGWAPPSGSVPLRVLAAGFEVANIDEQVRALQGGEPGPSFRLGTLATAGPRLASVTSLSDLRSTLATSAWRDPGGETPDALHLGLRLAWAARVGASVPGAQEWAAGAAALLVAREVLLAGRRPVDQALRVAAPLLGRAWPRSRSLPELAALLPRRAQWALHDVEDGEDLWRAEAAWWRRVEHDGFALLRSPGATLQPCVGAVAVLAVDAWRVRVALELAARVPSPEAALEAFDAVA